ncbi:MAG: hypothetical protein JSS83_28710 [Cyanobacteria bacterium SZAS LIN-3]|nr:hypothetical protein [Cyanobacteria bacterium SZAS LIN-3]
MQKFLYKRRVLLAGLATIAFVGVFVLGILRLFNYTLPLYIGNPVSASESGYGDPVVALYDAALRTYQAQDYEAAGKLAAQAYSKMSEEHGAIGTDARSQKVAGDIQFLLGLTCEKVKQQQQAIEAYEQALRHTPDNLPAKYNLERLLKAQQGGGAGGGGQQPGQKPGGGASHQGKKGI